VYDGDGKPLYEEDSATAYKVPAGRIVSDTTFTLRASVTTGFDTSYHYASITVTITNPILNALTVTGDIAAKSRLDVDGVLRTKGELQATGYVTVSNGMGIYCYNEEVVLADFSGGQARLPVFLLAEGGVEVYGDVTVRGEMSNSDRKLTTEGTNGLRVRSLTYDEDL
jgi:nitrous oxidase accessory protein NosD